MLFREEIARSIFFRISSQLHKKNLSVSELFYLNPKQCLNYFLSDLSKYLFVRKKS